MSTIAIRKKVSFAAVPDIVFSLPMRPASILLLAWALGRPDGWQFHISHMLHVLRYSEEQWKSAKKELIKNGFFNQAKRQDETGKIVWDNEFCDDPLWLSASPTPTSTPTIPPKTTDGFPMAGNSMAGKVGDIAKYGYSKVLKAVEAERTENEPAAAFLKQDQNPKPKPACSNTAGDICQQLVEPFLKNETDKLRWTVLLANVDHDKLLAKIQEIIVTGKNPYVSTIMKWANTDKKQAANKLAEEVQAAIDASPRLKVDPAEFKALLATFKRGSETNNQPKGV